MYYLRIKNNDFSFVIKGINNIEENDIHIEGPDYFSFLKQQSDGKEYKLKEKHNGTSLYDLIEIINNL